MRILGIAAMLIAAASSGRVQIQTAPPAGTTAEAIVQRFVDAANARDADRMADLVAPDAVFATFPGGQVIAQSRDAIREHYRRQLQSLPTGFRVDIHPRIVEGEFVIDQEHFTALPGRTQATWMYQVHGGLIRRAWMFEGAGGVRQAAGAFSRRLESQRARPTSAAITVAPQRSEIRPRLMDLAGGRLLVLSLPIAITNSSGHEIRMRLAHEWYGGVWPPTDLYAAVQSEGPDGRIWSDAPGYLVGEKDSADSRLVLKPRETKTFDVRLNWPGTGSIPAERLIDEAKPGKYSIKFLLFFRVNGVDEYVESQPTEIEVGK